MSFRLQPLTYHTNQRWCECDVPNDFVPPGGYSLHTPRGLSAQTLQKGNNMNKRFIQGVAAFFMVFAVFACCHADDFLPIGNGAEGISIAKYPVTNEEYAEFVKETGHAAPSYWKNGTFPDGKERHPVLWVSYDDACAYCDWLGSKDTEHIYRIPTEAEWETAAGETPSNAEFNFNGVVASHYVREDPKRQVTFVHPKSAFLDQSMPLDEVLSVTPDGRVRGWVNHSDYTGFIYTDLFKELSDTGGYTTPVDAYPTTRSACGALDMWGNCWEWTCTQIVATNGAERGQTVNAIKGGSWYANHNSCLTSFHGEGRRPGGHFNTVDFRVVRANPDSPNARPDLSAQAPQENPEPQYDRPRRGPRPNGENGGMNPPPRRPRPQDGNYRPGPRPNGENGGMNPPPRRPRPQDGNYRPGPRPNGENGGMNPPPRRPRPQNENFKR